MKNLFLHLPRIKKQMIAASADFSCLPILFYFALILRFSGLTLDLLSQYGLLALATAAASIPIFISLGLYRAVIRYIDQKIISTVILAATLSTVVLAVFSFIIKGEQCTPTTLWIYWVNTILYLLTSRFAARGFLLRARDINHRRVAIYGAGKTGSLLVTELVAGQQYRPAFFIDDNPQLHHTTVHGIKVFPSNRLPELAEKYRINAILLAMPSLTRSQQRCIINRLEPLKISIKIPPPMTAVMNGLARAEDVRQIEIEDLLSRDQVEPNPRLLSSCIYGKCIMVSGAGGSIGSELCRQIIALQPKRLILFDISEFSLYTIEQELQNINVAEDLRVELIACIGSVLNYEKCKAVLSTFAVDTVYHAAAYKHVPLVESNPIEGIQNNAFGTLNFANAAMAAEVKCFVLISSDKAVRPTNVMGATKRLSELILQAFAVQGSKTCFSMVRFGNVLGSSGSVVPLFRKQIAAGGPITLTHPEITRYFMTIPEAAQLVLQAGSMGKGGDVFVLDMGKPMRIADLAERMIHLSGHEVKSADAPHGAIEIQYIGLRPGEKLYEELLIGTNVTGTEHPLIMRAQEAAIEWPFLKIMLNQLDDACERCDHEAIRTQLLKMINGYHPSSEIVDFVWQEKMTKNFPKEEQIR